MKTLQLLLALLLCTTLTQAQSIERQLGSFVNPSQTVRPWSLVLAYLLTDPLFLYQ